MHVTAQLLSGHLASSLGTPCPWPELWERGRSPLGWGEESGPRVAPASPCSPPPPPRPLVSRPSSLERLLPPSSLPPHNCPTCLQGLQRANRCGRAFEISMPYKFKVFGNGFLINLPTLSFWKRQKSQIHSRFHLPWYFLSRWLQSCSLCVLCTST